MTKSQVVVAYDFTKQADLALERAIDLACRDPHNVLHFLTVVDSQQTYETTDRIREDLLVRLNALFSARAPGVELEFYTHARIGKPAAEILDLAKEVGADLVIVGSHDRGAVGRMLLGSVSTEVLHKALCPVLVARPKGYEDVQLEKVIAVETPVTMRPRAHRYSYNSGIAQLRPVDWPI